MFRRILRFPEVSHITGLPRSSIYQRMADGKFPKSVPLGGRLVGWPSDVIDEYVNVTANGKVWSDDDTRIKADES